MLFPFHLKGRVMMRDAANGANGRQISKCIGLQKTALTLHWAVRGQVITAHQLLVKPANLLRFSHGAAVLFDRALPENCETSELQQREQQAVSCRQHGAKKKQGIEDGAALCLIQRLLHLIREHYTSSIAAV